MAINVPNETELSILDDLAVKYIAANIRLRFGVARSATELEVVYRLRYQKTIEKGWAQPQMYPDGLERDHYDSHATHIAGWYADTLVATIRLVFPFAGKLLPTEAAFKLCITPHNQFVDIGRVIVAQPDTRSSEHIVLLGLFGRMWQEMRSRGYSQICGTLSSSAVRLYRMVGLETEILADARPYMGEVRYPCKIDMVKTAVTLQRHWQNFENNAQAGPLSLVEVAG